MFLLGNKKRLEKTFMQMFHCKPIELIDQILMAHVVCTETVGKKRFKWDLNCDRDLSYCLYVPWNMKVWTKMFSFDLEMHKL